MVRADRTLLTDKCPRLENRREVSSLSDGQADTIAGVENAYD